MIVIKELTFIPVFDIKLSPDKNGHTKSRSPK